MGDLKKAEQLYNEAVNTEDFLSRFYVGTYVEEHNFATFALPPMPNGIEKMTLSAKAGYAPAQYQLGLYYLFEHYHRDAAVEVIEDENFAYKKKSELEKEEQDLGLRWMKVAADQNHGDACIVMANLFSNGYFGVTKSDESAVIYYQRGAENGDANCMYRLGRCYYHACGVEENNEKAFNWYCKARNAGCKSMWHPLGECYMNGWGTKQNIPWAINAFEKQLQEGPSGFNDASREKLAYIYIGSRGFQFANFEKAVYYAKQISDDDTVAEILGEIPNAKQQYENWKSTQSPQQPSGKSPGASPTHTPTSPNSGNKTSGGCYVATSVYGSYDCPEVWTLRRFRDYSLATTWYGRIFVYAYYAISPTIVKWFGKTEWFNRFWKHKLDRFVKSLNDIGVANTPYNDRQLKGMKTMADYRCKCNGCKYANPNDRSGYKWYCSYYRTYEDPDIIHECKAFVSQDSSEGCFLTEACCNYRGLSDNCKELTILRDFRDNTLSQSEMGTKLIAHYYKIAPDIVEQINSSENRNKLYSEIFDSIKEIVYCIKEKDNLHAVIGYVLMVLDIQEQLLHD